MASSEKRCLYEVLGVERDCTADEIRSAYRKLALQRHPDKLVKSGVSEAEATASFQELVNAYEVLSDPRERAWYDSHRSQILFASSNVSKSKSKATLVPDLFSFFSNSVYSGFSDTGKGFYKVYGDVFDKIYQNELNFANKMGLGIGSVKEAPLMGNLKSPYTQVNAFYGYWLGFVTVMDFVWVDEYDAMAGPNRKSRRVMEDENKKLRKKARREYNDTVRGLAEFAKKRDKRVIDMQVKKNEEMERKREEEKQRKKQMEREKLERAMAYEEPDWAKVEEIEEEEIVEESEKKNELYCVVCGKKFKSDKQWKNHEQSKKHKEKVAEFRAALADEERENGEAKQEEELLGDDENDKEDVFVFADAVLDELKEQFEDDVKIEESNQKDEQANESSEEEMFVDIRNNDGLEGESDDDEASILKAMVNQKKAGKLRKPKVSFAEVTSDVDRDEMDSMEYNNRKGSRKTRGSRKERSKRATDEAEKTNGAFIAKSAEEIKKPEESSSVEEVPSHSLAETESNSQEVDIRKPKVSFTEVIAEVVGDEINSMVNNNLKDSRTTGSRKEEGKRASDKADRTDEADIITSGEETRRRDESSYAEEGQSHPLAESNSQEVGCSDANSSETSSKASDQPVKSHKTPKQAVEKKVSTKEAKAKAKNGTRGKKQKATAADGHVCEKCGADFESRNKLHKHLSDTGHASLKAR